MTFLFGLILTFILVIALASLWTLSDRNYETTDTVAKAYDSWTNDRILETLWGEHIHLGFYETSFLRKDFRQAKVDLVHQLVKWGGLDRLPKGSRILDVGCGIGGSSRILAKDYGFDVLGITISLSQVERARELTPSEMNCRFQVMDAMNLDFEKGTFDGVWSVEAGPHMPNKQLYADEMLRVLRPGGVLVVADWNQRDLNIRKMSGIEKIIMQQLLNQWAHPEFSSIKGFKNYLLNSRFVGSSVETADWTKYTTPSWIDSIVEGLRRPMSIIRFGPMGLLKAFREIPTILLMYWSFAKGLMQFGVFKTRG